MEEHISAPEAKRKLSSILRHVRDGVSYVVTIRGRPVARVVPIGKQQRVASAARAALLSHLETQSHVKCGHWTRDELYQDEH